MINITVALPADLFDFAVIRREAFRGFVRSSRFSGPEPTERALTEIMDRVDTFLMVSPLEHAACARVAAQRGLGLTAQRCLHWANERTKAAQLGRERLIAEVWHGYLNDGSGRA